MRWLTVVLDTESRRANFLLIFPMINGQLFIPHNMAPVGCWENWSDLTLKRGRKSINFSKMINSRGSMVVSTIEPLEASENDLLVVHSVEYLRSLKDALKIAKIVEFALGVLPNFFNILQPFRFQTGGTILAGEIALKRGWSINLGGGFHHCSGNEGGRYCPYADITLLIKFMREKHPEIVHVMIIDLGAHQGTGYQRDIVDSKDTQTYVLDMYNPDTYPKDGYAKTAINRKEELKSYMEDAEYLELVQTHVEGALKELTLKESPPDVVVYNAGTDVLDGDPLGKLAVTRKGVIERDFIVFKAVRDQKIPIIMLTSGGYERSNARIIADSILNLHKEGKLTVNKQHQ